VVFALLALAPTGYASGATSNPWILAVGGAIGLVLIAFGLWERRTGTRR
jgi:hypothetical protein